jgi:hypothetical protein
VFSDLNADYPKFIMRDDTQLEKRELRLKIGRGRRRIDARLRAAEAEGRKLASWRTYVTRYPAAAVLAAFGLGLSGATVSAPRGILGSLGSVLLRGSAQRATNLAWRELRRWWKSAGEQP